MFPRAAESNPQVPIETSFPGLHCTPNPPHLCLHTSLAPACSSSSRMFTGLACLNISSPGRGSPTASFKCPRTFSPLLHLCFFLSLESLLIFFLNWFYPMRERLCSSCPLLHSKGLASSSCLIKIDGMNGRQVLTTRGPQRHPQESPGTP